MINDFAGSAVRAGHFYNFCEQNGYSLDQVLTSIDFEKDADTFAATKLADAGLLDPQFASKIPADGSVAKSILPFTLLGGSALAIVHAKPNAIVEEHAHTKGSLRIILSGEYKFTGLPAGDMTLKAGDWIYIPRGQKYGYVTGPDGAASVCPLLPLAQSLMKVRKISRPLDFCSGRGRAVHAYAQEGSPMQAGVGLRGVFVSLAAHFNVQTTSQPK